ncbi:MAG: hypothetical protein ACLTK8_01220 [Paeniclostridium sp.]
MISSIMKVAVENQGIGLITSIIVYFIKEIFGITGGWLISLFALFLSILFVFNISIQDLIFAIKINQQILKIAMQISKIC